MKKTKVVLIALAFSGFAFGQSGVMDLEQCLEYGMQNSPYMTLAKNELENFKYDRRELISDYLPSINGQFQLDYHTKLATTVMPASSFGFDDLLPPGFAPEVQEDFRVKMGLPHTNTATIQLDQKIYDQVSLIGMRGVKDYKEMSDLKSEQQIEDLSYSIAGAYYQVLIVEQQIKLLQENKTQYEELEIIMALQLEKGVIRDVEYKQVKLALNNIKAQLSLIEVNRKTALNSLKVNMGMPIQETIEIKSDESLLRETALPLDEEISVSNRLDIRITQKNIDLMELGTKATKYAFLPTLSGYARYGANSYAENFKDSWKEFYDFSSIGLTLRVPIFNGLKVNTNYHKQRIQLENLKAQSTLMEEGYKLEQLNARTKMVEAHTSFKINQENLELAQEVYETTNLSYQKGAASLSDFLNADYSYKEAQTNYLTSMINMLTSRLDYEKSKGNLSNYLNNK